MSYTAAGQYNAYRQTQVQTASPAELVVMLYRGAVRFTKAGIEGINQRDIQAAHTGFLRAQQIVAELNGSLNFDHGDKLPRQLQAIYVWVNQLLVRANIEKTAEPAEQALQLLEELLSAWVQVSATQKTPVGVARAA